MVKSSGNIWEQSSCTREQDGPEWKYVFLLFIPIIRSTVLTRRRADASDYTAIDMWAVIDIVAFIYILYVIVSRWHEIPWNQIKRSSFIWWIIYYSFCFFSFLWCIPGSSIPYIVFRSLFMLGMSIYTPWLISKFRDKDIAFLNIVKYIFWVSCLGVLNAVKSMIFHTNSYSISAGIVLIILIALHVKIDGKKYKTMLFLSACFLIIGTCATSNIAFAGAVLIWMINPSKKISFFLTIISLLIIYLIYSYGFSYIVQYLMPGKTAEEVSSLTGRISIWENYYNAWQQSPWLGYGFPVGERAGAAWGYVYCLSAHNGFISVLINTGIVGMLIFVFFILSFLFKLYSNIRHGVPYTQPIFLAFVVMVVNNLSFPLLGSIWTTETQSCLFLFAYCTIFGNDTENRRG